MERMALRRLFFGSRPDPDRIFLHDLWFRGHNNPRFARAGAAAAEARRLPDHDLRLAAPRAGSPPAIDAESALPLVRQVSEPALCIHVHDRHRPDPIVRSNRRRSRRAPLRRSGSRAAQPAEHHGSRADHRGREATACRARCHHSDSRDPSRGRSSTRSRRPTSAPGRSKASRSGRSRCHRLHLRILPRSG